LLRTYILVRKIGLLKSLNQRKVYRTGTEDVTQSDIEIPLERVLEVLHGIRGMIANEHQTVIN
jgi:FAD/FMN-containing dehydrogenase